ncbi:MAG: DMT family transporter [Clostridia bacterium]|nr:DMT family transporter [Clostridia bacterium]
MSWFFFALICLLGWGCADLFYKKGTDEHDRYSHLRIAVWVGLVMGICAIIMMLIPFDEELKTPMSVGALIENGIKYSPASLCYILSMVIGYAGLRYMEVSIVSPVQNASGGLSAIFMTVYFLIVGRLESISEIFDPLTTVGTILIVLGVIALAIVEQRLAREERRLNPPEKKYRFGALALLFPILYCLFDTLGTAADGIILDEEVGLGLGEVDVLILYGLTFLLAGLIAWIFLWIREKKPYNPFARTELTKGIAACCEEFGQVFYVFAMARNPVVAAPIVASYCVVSVLLARIFLKEKLKAAQYACIFAVIAGIIVIGFVGD